MNKKEIEFYLKFHKGFRKRHDLNSALKSNSLLLNSERFIGWSKIIMRIFEFIILVLRILKYILFTECKIFKKRWLIHSVFLGVVLTTILEDGGQFKWGFVALLICLDRSINFILLRRGFWIKKKLSFIRSFTKGLEKTILLILYSNLICYGGVSFKRN